MSETRKSRMVLLLIAGIPLTMILAATWLWYFVINGELDLIGTLGTANRGTLVQPPRQIDDQPLFEAGAEATFAELEPKWTLLVPSSGAVCDARCEETLYLTRQIHVAMGKNFPRIRRMLVGTMPAEEVTLGFSELSDGRPAPESFALLLERDHQGIEARNTSVAGAEALFSEWQEDPSTWYLIDPRGWVMMSYNKDIPYKDVISDLKFLLKNSSN